MRRFALNVNEDKPVSEIDVQDLVLNAGCKAILEIVQRKIDMLNFLSRSAC